MLIMKMLMTMMRWMSVANVDLYLGGWLQPKKKSLDFQDLPYKVILLF